MKGAWHAVAEAPRTKRALCAGEQSDREGPRPLFSPAVLRLNKYLPYGGVKSHSTLTKPLRFPKGRRATLIRSVHKQDGRLRLRARKEGYLVHAIISTPLMRSICGFWAQSNSQRIL